MTDGRSNLLTTTVPVVYVRMIECSRALLTCCTNRTLHQQETRAYIYWLHIYVHAGFRALRGMDYKDRRDFRRKMRQCIVCWVKCEEQRLSSGLQVFLGRESAGGCAVSSVMRMCFQLTSQLSNLLHTEQLHFTALCSIVVHESTPPIAAVTARAPFLLSWPT